MVVYVHRKADNNEIFYVGIGSKERSIRKSRRNKFWRNTERKHGRIVNIVDENLTRDQAIFYERFLIKKFGRKDLNKGTLVNLTDGGDGRFNSPPSEETKEKIRKTLTGSKLSKEALRKIRRGNHYKAIKIIDTKTGEIFNCVLDAFEKYKIPKTTLHRWLKDNSKNKSNLIYYK